MTHSFPTRRSCELSRWNDAGQGQISPVEFIPVAEESGLINPLGRWAMYEAAQTLAKWARQYGKVMPIGVSVNLSPIPMAGHDRPREVEKARHFPTASGRRLTVEMEGREQTADTGKTPRV